MTFNSIGFWIAIIIVIVIIIGGLLWGYFHKDKCPYCGSENTVLDYITGNSNWGIWHMHCKDCLREFEVNGLSTFNRKKKND